ncbi:hypothetical protein BGW41_006037 [Actinomortierella wolfii]|nr:hypothetical protein BGW41_006037 [Actinomortierella wolfii]
MTSTLMTKYKTLKAKRSQNKLDALSSEQSKSKSDSRLFVGKHQKNKNATTKSSPSASSPPKQESSDFDLGEAFSYTLFLAEWFAAFNKAIDAACTSCSQSSSSTPLGADHSVHVDTIRKKKVVKALQKAPPSQVNEVIAILKAMPDPTIAEFKKEHSRQASRQDGASSPPPQNENTEALDEWKKVDRKRSGQLSNDQGTGLIDPESIHPPSSWWAVSFSSLLSSITVTQQDLAEAEKADVAAKTTAASAAEKSKPERNSSWFFGSNGTKDKETASTASKESKSVSTFSATAAPSTTAAKKSSAERLAEAAAAILVANTPKPESNKVAKKSSKTSLTGKTSSAVGTLKDKDKDAKATLVSTINSISKQLIAQLAAPPTHTISAYTYWWGYEIYVPHNCMSKLQRAANTSQIFFGFLSGAIAGVPGLAALVPLTKIISAWVGFQWAVIQAEDVGKGVILSATWILPVALAPRSWDHPGSDTSTSTKQVVTKAMKKIKAT